MCLMVSVAPVFCARKSRHTRCALVTGVQTWALPSCFAETQARAQDLGMTADDLLARRKGQAFSAEEAYAARAIRAKSGNELVTMAKRLRSVGEDPGSDRESVR